MRGIEGQGISPSMAEECAIMASRIDFSPFVVKKKREDVLRSYNSGTCSISEHLL